MTKGTKPDTKADSSREPTLLERVSRGDKLAVSEVLETYGPLIWSIARKGLGPALAEDAVQEVFIEIWKHAKRYDPERASEAAYIATIARRRVIDHGRRVGRRPEVEEVPEETPDTDNSLELVELADEARIAKEALAELKPEQQRVLKLSIVEGLTHSEIATTTQLPLGTVKSHARRGLERVRTLLQERREASGEVR